MPSAKPTKLVEPRIYSRREVALLLGKGETWLSNKMEELVRAEMPPFDPLLNGWDAKAINLWLDRRSGLNMKQSGTPDDHAP